MIITQLLGNLRCEVHTTHLEQHLGHDDKIGCGRWQKQQTRASALAPRLERQVQSRVAYKAYHSPGGCNISFCPVKVWIGPIASPVRASARVIVISVARSLGDTGYEKGDQKVSSGSSRNLFSKPRDEHVTHFISSEFSK